MDPVIARIEAWQRAGLIDGVTADRLRADEAARTVEPDRPSDAAAPAPTPPASDADRPRIAVTPMDILGPGPTVAELFAYLGAGFVFAAWSAFVARLSGSSGIALTGGGFLVAAVVLGAMGLVLRRGDARRRRAAGIAFLAATLYAVAGAAAILGSVNVYGPGGQLILATLAVAIAAAFRFLHAGLLTQFGLLASLTAFARSLLEYLDDLVRPDTFSEKGVPIGGTPDPILLILVAASVWLLLALGLGLLALRESDGRRDSATAPGAPGRRAALTRAWAGTVAVVGLTMALSRSDVLADGDVGRVVPPWIMDAILVGLAAILLERAFRRDSGAFLFAAGLALVTALTDFNFSYLSSSSELGLLIEGGLLLAVGFGADRLRRRLGGPGSSAPPAEPQPSEAPA
jgi:hypothetical protein